MKGKLMKKSFILLLLTIVSIVMFVSCNQDSAEPVSNVIEISNMNEVLHDMSPLSGLRVNISGNVTAMGINASEEDASRSLREWFPSFRWFGLYDGESEAAPVTFIADEESTDFNGNDIDPGTVISQDEIPGTIDKMYVLGDFTLVSYLTVDTQDLIDKAQENGNRIQATLRVGNQELSFSYVKDSSEFSLSYDNGFNRYTEIISFRCEDSSFRPLNENENVTYHDIDDYYNSVFRYSVIVDNRTGIMYDIGEYSLSAHNGIAYEKNLGPVSISVNGNGNLVLSPIITNPDIFVYSLFQDVYGQYYILNDSLNAVSGNYLYFTKPGAYIPASDGTVLHIEFNKSILQGDLYGNDLRTESIKSIKIVGEGFSEHVIPEDCVIEMNYSAKLDFEDMPKALSDTNKNNGHSLNAVFPENGSWYTFTKVSDGILYCNYFRDDKSMVFCRIDLSNFKMRFNYYFAESDEYYYSLGNDAALVISDSLNSNGDYGVYVVYPFEGEEYRQRAFDLVVDTEGNVSEMFNTSDPNFADIKDYSDFKDKFYHAYLIVNSDQMVFDEDQQQLWDYPHERRYNSEKGHNEYIFYVWKTGFSEQTFRDLYYKDSYDREELGKHTVLNKIKHDQNSFKKVTNPMDLSFKVIGLSDTRVYMLREINGEFIAQETGLNEHKIDSVVLQPVNTRP